MFIVKKLTTLQTYNLTEGCFGALSSECQAEDGGSVGGDTETVVGAEADEPEDGARGIGDDELTALLKEGALQVGEEVC